MYGAKINTNSQGNSWTVITRIRREREGMNRWNELSRYLVCHIDKSEIDETKKASGL